jgi:Ca-activated chloride channel family protein
VLEAGYRPADLSVKIDSSTSPISPANGVDPSQPQTTLQMPSPAVVQIVRDVWWLTKRHTNVYLVADTSGSMEGDKLARAREGLLAFLEQIKGDSERVGLVAFSSSVYNVLELNELRVNRAQLTTTINGLAAGGDTALLDAVAQAYGRLQTLRDTQRINAIVVMTDGKENNSYITLSQLVNQIKRGNQSGVPVIIFCIAYGNDADMNTLQQIASASGGQVRAGDLETIRGLYQILSTYF